MAFSKVYSLTELIEFGLKIGLHSNSEGESMGSEVHYSIYVDGVRTIYECDIDEYEDENLVKLLKAFMKAHDIKGELYLTK